jgi:hypothetical protein
MCSTIDMGLGFAEEKARDCLGWEAPRPINIEHRR